MTCTSAFFLPQEFNLRARQTAGERCQGNRWQQVPWEGARFLGPTGDRAWLVMSQDTFVRLLDCLASMLTLDRPPSPSTLFQVLECDGEAVYMSLSSRGKTSRRCRLWCLVASLSYLWRSTLVPVLR